MRLRFATISSLWLMLFVSVFQIESGYGIKILKISLMSTTGNKITYEPLLQDLARRGHEVSAIGPIVSKNETNFRNIQTVDPEEFLKSTGNFFELRLNMGFIMDYFGNPFVVLGSKMEALCAESYNNPHVQQVLKEKYDLVFFTQMFNECLYGLIHKMNTTTIIFQQSPILPYVTDTLGTPSPSAFVSSITVGYSDQMNFKERMWNIFKTSYDWAVVNLSYYPLMEKIYRKALKDPTLPSCKEILKNTSLILTSSHITYQRPRPFFPHVIEVGGMHLKPSKPVPAAVYVSLVK